MWGWVETKHFLLMNVLIKPIDCGGLGALLLPPGDCLGGYIAVCSDTVCCRCKDGGRASFVHNCSIFANWHVS